MLAPGMTPVGQKASRGTKIEFRNPCAELESTKINKCALFWKAELKFANLPSLG